jgi:hypothetical protein
MAAKPRAKSKEKEILLDVVGLQYRVTKPIARVLASYLPFAAYVEREPRNLHDPNAIKVSIDPLGKIPHAGMQLGYLRRDVAEVWAEEIDAGRLLIESAVIEQLYPDELYAKVRVTVRKFGSTKR